MANEASPMIDSMATIILTKFPEGERCPYPTVVNVCKLKKKLWMKSLMKFPALMLVICCTMIKVYVNPKNTLMPKM